MRKLLFLFLILFLPLNVFAHQPRIVEGGQLVEIKNPDIPQAFYGELNGIPQSFKMNLAEDREVYLGILVPDLPDIDKDILVEITSPSDRYFYYFLDGSLYEWDRYYEELTGDYYHKGPEAKIALKQGEYSIKVFSFSSTGKYVLTVGEKEEFSLTEVFKTLLILPSIKTNFFEKSVFTIFLNRIGLYFLLSVVIISILVITFIVFLIIRYKRKKAEKPWILQ